MPTAKQMAYANDVMSDRIQALRDALEDIRYAVASTDRYLAMATLEDIYARAREALENDAKEA